MTRAALLLSSLFFAACTVGDIPKNGNGGVDAAPGGDSGGTGTDGSVKAAGCVDRITPPGDAHPHAGGVTHAGEGCVVSGCHLANAPGAGAPGFQFAGTIYKPGAGKIPSTGVTVTVKAANGTTAVGVTDSAGNFNIVAGTLQNPFPATVSVTACPTLAPMVSQLVQGGGNCTSAACHAGTAAGATPSISLADQ
jgi:hypothetical protein